MKELDILLFHRFNRNGSDIRPRDRIENRFRIVKIIFLAFDKGFNMAGIEQFDVMTQRNQLS